MARGPVLVARTHAVSSAASAGMFEALRPAPRSKLLVLHSGSRPIKRHQVRRTCVATAAFDFLLKRKTRAWSSRLIVAALKRPEDFKLSAPPAKAAWTRTRAKFNGTAVYGHRRLSAGRH